MLELELYYLSIIMDQFTLVFPPTDPPKNQVLCFCFHLIYCPPPIPYFLDLSFSFLFFLFTFSISTQFNHFYFSPLLL